MGTYTRAALEHRAALAAVVLGLILLMVRLVAIQGVLVMAAAAQATARGPLNDAFQDCCRRIVDIKAKVDMPLDALRQAQATYDATQAELAQIRHEAAHHVSLIGDHVTAVGRSYVRGVRLGMDEPVDQDLGLTELPVASTVDAVKFVDSYWISGGEGLPTKLECDDLPAGEGPQRPQEGEQVTSTHAPEGTPHRPDLGGWRIPAPRTYPPRDLPSQARPIRLGRIQGDAAVLAEAARRVTVQLLIDCSGSEYGSGGDPSGIRMACGRSLLQLMKRTGGGSMSVVHWGSSPRATLPLTSVAAGFAQLDQALKADPGSMGGNDFPAALRMASDLQSAASPDSLPLVLGITDGLEDITLSMRAAIAALPRGSVHVLLVPGHACGEELAAQWQSLPLGSFTRLPNDRIALAHHRDPLRRHHRRESPRVQFAHSPPPGVHSIEGRSCPTAVVTEH